MGITFHNGHYHKSLYRITRAITTPKMLQLPCRSRPDARQSTAFCTPLRPNGHARFPGLAADCVARNPQGSLCARNTHCQAPILESFLDAELKRLDYTLTYIAPEQANRLKELGTWLANYIGLGGALWLSAGLRLLGFLFFLKPDLRGVLFRQVERATNE